MDILGSISGLSGEKLASNRVNCDTVLSFGSTPRFDVKIVNPLKPKLV
jgi:hypothetical protein